MGFYLGPLTLRLVPLSMGTLFKDPLRESEGNTRHSKHHLGFRV